MAALFYQYSDQNILQMSVSSVAASPFKCDLFDGLFDTKTYAMIFTELGVQLNETIQYFLTFVDVIHYYYFGKGLGQITVRGVMFEQCNNGKSTSSIPGFDELWRLLGTKRGQTVNLSFRTASFDCVLMDYSFMQVAEPENMVNFSVGLAVINTVTWPSPQPNTAC